MQYGEDKEKSKVYLPKIGWIKAKLHREITTVKTVTVSVEANQFYVSILTEFQNEKPNNSPLSVGLDVGIVNFAALSDNTIIEPISFTKEQKRLIVL